MDSSKMPDNVVPFPGSEQPETPAAPTPEQEELIKKMAEEIAKEPFFSFLGRLGDEFSQHEHEMRNRINFVIARTWPRGTPCEQPQFLKRLLDEIDERFRDIASRFELIGSMAARSKTGAEAAVALKQAADAATPAPEAQP